MANTFFEMQLGDGKTLRLIAISGENHKPILQIQTWDEQEVTVGFLTTKQVKQLKKGLHEYLHDGDICSTNNTKTSIEDCKPIP